MNKQLSLFELQDDPAAVRRFVAAEVPKLALQASERDLLLAIGHLGTLGEKGSDDQHKIVFDGPMSAIEKLVKGGRQIRRTIRPRCERAGLLEYIERSGKPSVWKLDLRAVLEPKIPADLYPAPSHPQENARQLRLIFPVETAAKTKTGRILNWVGAVAGWFYPGRVRPEVRTSEAAQLPKSGLPEASRGGSPDFSAASSTDVRTSGPLVRTTTPDVRGPETLENLAKSGVGPPEVRTSEPRSPDFSPHVHVHNPPSPPSQKQRSIIHPADGVLRNWRVRRRILKRDIPLDDLQRIERILELYELAVEARIVPETDEVRFEFAALCYSLWRNRQGADGKGLKNPVGFLHAKLGYGYPAWRDQADDERDRAWAKAELRKLDEPPGTSPQDPYLAGLQTERAEGREAAAAASAAETSRARQMAALRALQGTEATP